MVATFKIKLTEGADWKLEGERSLMFSKIDNYIRRIAKEVLEESKEKAH